MPDSPVIRVENLGKRYTLGRATGLPYATLRETLMHRLTAPVRWWQRRGPAPSGGASAAAKPGDFWALDDVSFEVNRGDVVGVIGRNGAGKSTLLKLLSRITEPTTGRITLEGRVASLLEVGTGFHPELTGRENVFLNGAILGMTRAEIRARFDEIVAFAEVEKFLDTPVKRYSSGMYVRLAFAVAAHLEPDILIVDEVLAVGDQEFQKKCLGKLERVTRTDGRTVLFVSHNLASVRQLCTRALLLQRGKIVRTGPPAEVISHYVQAAANPAAGTENYRHIQGDGRAQIQRVRLHSEVEAEPVYAVFEPVKIDLHYTLKNELAAIEFFLLIYSEEGDCLAAIFQRDSGELTRPSGLAGVASLVFKNPFAPGRYLVSAGIFDANRQFLDWVEFAESFQVETGFADGRNYDGRLGRFTVVPEWSAR